MKICLPTNDNLGLQSEIAANFSAAPWLQVIDSETLTVNVIDVLDGSQRDKPIDMDLIMCRGMTEHLYQALRAQGVPIYGCKAQRVGEALDEFRAGDLRDLADWNCCRGTRDDCDGEHLAGECETN